MSEGLFPDVHELYEQFPSSETEYKGRGAVHTSREIAVWMAEASIERAVRTEIIQRYGEHAPLELIPEAWSSEKRIEYSEMILGILSDLTICDPACGYGALLLGIAECLLQWYQRYFRVRFAEEDEYPSETILREHIVSQLYGVDIEMESVTKTRMVLSQWAGSTACLPKMEQNIKCGDAVSGFGSFKEIETCSKHGLLLYVSSFSRDDIYTCLRTENTDNSEVRMELDTLYTSHFISPHVTAQDTDENIPLFHWPYEFADVFLEADGFSVIISNPPYIRNESLKDTQKTILGAYYDQQFFHTYREAFPMRSDLSMYFLLRSYSLLMARGIFVDLISNKWLRTEYAAVYRRFLAEKMTIYRIIDFNNVKLFPVTVHALIMVAMKMPPSSNHKITYHFEPPTLDVLQTERLQYPQRKLDAKGWIFVSELRQQIHTYLEQFPTLEKHGYTIRVGYKTGYLKAFLCTMDERNSIVNEEPLSAQFFHRLFRGRAMEKYRLRWEQEWLLLIPQGYTNEHRGQQDPYEWMHQYHSKVMQYLERYIGMRSRGNGILKRSNQGEYWWEGIASKVLTLFSKPKLCWQEISTESCFCVDTTGIYANPKIIMLFSDNVPQLKTLACIFNSPFIEWVYDAFGIRLGHQYEWKKHRIKALRIPPLTTDLTKVYNIQHFLTYYPNTLSSEDTNQWQHILLHIVYEYFFAAYYATEYDDTDSLITLLKPLLPNIPYQRWFTLQWQEELQTITTEEKKSLDEKITTIQQCIREVLPQSLNTASIQELCARRMEYEWLKKIHR